MISEIEKALIPRIEKIVGGLLEAKENGNEIHDIIQPMCEKAAKETVGILFGNMKITPLERFELFEEAFRTGGAGAVRDCPCGKTYYNPDSSWSWKEGELEKLQSHPDAYELNYPVETIMLSREEYALDCDCWHPMGHALIYQIFANAHQIAKFLSLEKARRQKIADQFPTVQETPEDTPEVARLKKWVADLQSGMYVNCVYCGHRYGPGETTPASMANALKKHIEQCPEHPMSKLKDEYDRLAFHVEYATSFAFPERHVKAYLQEALEPDGKGQEEALCEEKPPRLQDFDLSTSEKNLASALFYYLRARSDARPAVNNSINDILNELCPGYVNL